MTSILELKLDQTTLFEWQRHSQSSTDVSHYEDLLKFLNLRAQASENSVSDKKQHKNDTHLMKPFGHNEMISSHAAHAVDSGVGVCVACKTEKHPLYACSKYKSLAHDQKVSILKEHGICINCLRPGHFVRQCQSQNRCRKCQRPHHTLLHVETTDGRPSPTDTSPSPASSILAHTTTGLPASSLLMTCQVVVNAPDGSVVKAHALLDSASSAYFVSERLAQSLSLPRSPLSVRISGIAGLTHKSPLHSLSIFTVSSARPSSKKLTVTQSSCYVSPVIYHTIRSHSNLSGTTCATYRWLTNTSGNQAESASSLVLTSSLLLSSLDEESDHLEHLLP